MTAQHLFAGYSAAQVREAERPLLEAGEPLMARAAAGLAQAVRAVLAERRGGRGRLLVLAGSGNNGGDALFAAAELLREGGSATVVPLGSRMHEAAVAAARSAGAAVLAPGTPVDEVVALARCADVILDGVLGTGAAASPALRPPASDLVTALLPLATDGVRVVAVDLPSGIGPDDGAVSGPVLPADVTVTFGAVKAGLLLPPGRDLAGEVRLVDIGLGPRLAEVEPLLRL